jgi:predicted permease
MGSVVSTLARFPNDLRIALRGLRREWPSSLFIILTLGLGIGANAAMFNVVDRLLVTGPSGIREPEQVRRLYHTEVEGRAGPITTGIFDYPALAALQRDTQDLAGAAGYVNQPGTLGRGVDAIPVNVTYATSGFFDVLGAAPAMGRGFDSTSHLATDRNLAVIGYGLWQSTFGNSKDVIGRTIVINDHPFTVIGVMPKGFTGAELARTDVWLPVENIGDQLGTDWRTGWDGPWIVLVARMRDGVMQAQAANNLTRLLRGAYGGSDPNSRVATVSLDLLTRNARSVWSSEASLSMWLAYLSLAALLIACMNVASLLSVRAERRRAALGVRVALGASRADLASLFVAEGLLLAVGGGIAAVAIAYAIGIPIRRTLLPNIDWPTAVINIRLVLLVAAAAVLLGVAVGLAPVRKAFGIRLTDLLRMVDGRGARRGVFGGSLTLVQATLSTVLLIATGLFVHSVLRARAIDFGFDPARTVGIDVQWPRLRYDDRAALDAEWLRREQYLSTAASRLAEMPGVQSATIAMGAPYSVGGSRTSVTPRNGPLAGSAVDRVSLTVAGPDYFATLDTRLLAGRAIDARDRADGERVAIVGRALAARLWPGSSPVGECVRLANVDAPCVRVIGVAEDTRQLSASTASTPRIYVPLSQTPLHDNLRLLIRSAVPVERLAPSVRGMMAALDPTVDFIRVGTLQESIDTSLRPYQLGALMFGLMAALAFVIAAVGLYGVVSYNSTRREHEMAIRRALGAAPSRVARLLMRRDVVATAIGVVAGSAIALAMGNRIEKLLYEGSVTDPVVLAGVAALLIATAIVAAAIPAFRLLRRPIANALQGR